MYVCMYVCMYVYMYVCMYVCIYVCIVITFSRAWINRVRFANPARGAAEHGNMNTPVPVRA